MFTYKGLNKIYFGIGIKRDYATFTHCEVYFYFFKLLQRNPEGEILKRGRDYKGFILQKRFLFTYFGINI